MAKQSDTKVASKTEPTIAERIAELDAEVERAQFDVQEAISNEATFPVRRREAIEKGDVDALKTMDAEREIASHRKVTAQARVLKLRSGRAELKMLAFQSEVDAIGPDIMRLEATVKEATAELMTLQNRGTGLHQGVERYRSQKKKIDQELRTFLSENDGVVHEPRAVRLPNPVN